MTQLFESGGQSIGVSASATVLPMSTQAMNEKPKSKPHAGVLVPDPAHLPPPTAVSQLSWAS